jgi:endonuclease/exonuclease/phosphatase (EEP) superfamily protein YafD
LIGDFNTTDQSEAYAILQQTLQDAHRQAGWGFGHTFPSEQLSWHGIPIPGHQVRIDMVWYTADFVALTAAVSERHGESDHSPVVAQLAWRE